MRKSLILALGCLSFTLGGCAGLSPFTDTDEETAETAADTPAAPDDDTARVIAEVTGAVEYADFPSDVLYALLSAEVAAQRGRFDVTLANYAQAARDTRDRGIIKRAMLIAQALNAENAQRQIAEVWLEVDPNEPQALRIAAIQAIRTGQFERAMDYMERLYDQGEDADFDSLANYARTLPEDERAELVALFEALHERHPGEPDITYSLALIRHGAGDNKAALEFLEPLLDEHPNYQPAITLKGKLLYDTGRREEARQYLRNEARRFPQNRQLGVLYARILVDSGDMQAAEDEFEALSRRFPEVSSLKLSRALVALENDNPDTAEPLLEELIESGVHTNEAHYYLGRLADDNDDVEKALHNYDQVEAGNHFFSALSRASYLRASEGELATVQENLNRLRGEIPQHGEQLWLIEINLLLDLEEHERALAVADQALDEHPDNHNARYARAMLYEKQDELEKMEADLRHILDQDPDNAIALNALGYTLTTRTDRYDEAYELIKKAYELAPDNPAIMDSMGWIYFKRGELEKALELLTKAHDLLPDPEIAAHLGEVLWKKDRREEARMIWRRSLADADDQEDVQPVLDTIERFNLDPEEL